jgi:hypothetical protein
MVARKLSDAQRVAVVDRQRHRTGRGQAGRNAFRGFHEKPESAERVLECDLPGASGRERQVVLR